MPTIKMHKPLVENENPTVTVVMAAYNAEDHVANAIRSVLSQPFPGWELICIDDGSTDKTHNIVHSCSVHDTRVRLISQKNLGPAEARRQGYIAGEGEYFIILNSDDLFAQDTLERLVAEAQENSVDGVVCKAMTFDKTMGAWMPFHEENEIGAISNISGYEAFKRTFPWRIHGIALWRRSVIKRVAVKREYCFNSYNADEFVTRKLFLACDAVCYGSGEYYIIKSENSLTRKFSSREISRLETDRKSVDLACQAWISEDFAACITQYERKKLLKVVRKISKFSCDGACRMAAREIWRSILHFRHVSSRLERKIEWYVLCLEILPSPCLEPGKG